MKTQAVINFRLADDPAQEDAQYAANDKQDFGYLTELNDEYEVSEKHITLEPDQWILDGSYRAFPNNLDDNKWGLWSLSRSDANSDIDVSLSISFDSVHTSIGIMLYFWDATDDWCASVEVTWYDGADEILHSEVYSNNEADMFIYQVVEFYKRIEVKFLSTNKPHRYVKLSRIMYGVDLNLDDELEVGKVVEEICPISEELSINTLTAKFTMKDAAFAKSIFEVMQLQQKVTAKEIVNDDTIDMGAFYLTKWSRSKSNERQISITAEDLIGGLSKRSYYGGMINNQRLEDVIDSLMTDYGTTLYTIDDDCKDILVSGYIAIMSYREALQRIAFAAGCVVDCSRSNKISIHKLNQGVITPIGVEFLGGKEEKSDTVTGVKITTSTYSIGSESIEVHSGTYEIGTYIVTFSEPVNNLQITGGNIITSNVNYAQIEVTAQGEVVITGTNYVESQIINQKNITNMLDTIVPNVYEYEISITSDEDILTKIFEYWTQNTESEASIIVQDIKAGSYVSQTAMHGLILTGTVVKLDIDLVGGFIGKAAIRGSVD